MHRGRTGALGPGGFEGLLSHFNDAAELEIRQSISPAVAPLWRETSARLGVWIASAVPSDGPEPTASPSDFLSRLSPPSQQFLQNKLGERGYQEFRDLLRERDPKIYLHQMWQFGRRLREEKHLEAAAWVFQNVAEMAEVLGASPEISAQARDDLRLMMGQGPWGRVLASQVQGILEESWDPSMVVGFGVAGAAYKLTRFFSLAKILSRPGLRFVLGEWGAQALAASVALGAEAPMFVAAAKATHELLGVRQNWEVEGLWREVQATGLTLLFLKGFGAASEKIFQSMHGIDPLRPAVARFSAFTRFSQVAVPQAGMYLGILLSQETERRLGWRSPSDGLHPLAEALVTLGHFNLGGWMADRALGRGFKAWQGHVDAATQILTQATPRFEFLGQVSPQAAGAPGEVFGPGVFLSENHEGDSGPRSGKVIQLFPTKSPAPPPVSDSEAPKKYTPAEIANLAKAQEAKAERLVRDFQNFIAAMNFQTLVYLGHLQKGRGYFAEVERMARGILDAERGLYETLFQAQKVHRDASSLTFLSSPDPVAHQSVLRSRSRLGHLLGVAKSMHESLKPLLEALQSREPLQLFRVMDAFPAKPDLRGDTIAAVQAMNQLVFEQSILGMVSGASLKNLFRSSAEELAFIESSGLQSDQKPMPLPPREASREDLQVMQAILRSLMSPAAAEKNYFNHFMARPLDGERTSPALGAREALRWGGDSQEPFATWVPIYVPMLLAFNGGDFSRFLERTAPVELLMPQETWVASRASAWWLSRALHAEKNVRSWEQELISEQRLPAVARVLSRRALSLAKRPRWNSREAALWLGERGDLAAWAHGLAAFARHPFDPRAAMELALDAPVIVREGAASVTGALLGAFNGKAMFSPEWTEDVVSRFVIGRAPLGSHLTAVFRDQSHMANLLAELSQTTRPYANGLRSQRLSSVPPSSTPWEAVRDSFELAFGERLADFQRAGTEAVRDLSSRIAKLGVSESPASLQDAFPLLRERFTELSEFVKASEKRLKALGAAWVPSGYFDPYRKKVRGAQKVLDRIGSVEVRLAESATSTKAGLSVELSLWAQNQLRVALKPMEPSPMKGLNRVSQPHPTLKRGEVIRLQTALGPIGKSAAPKTPAPFFDQRSDRAMVDFIVNRFQGMLPEPTAGVENVLEVYLVAIGSKVLRGTAFTLANQVSLSAMLSVILPAYVELNRDRIDLAYQELKFISPQTSGRIKESWRAVTYLALRLLEGAKADDRLLQETVQFLGESPVAKRLQRLREIRQASNPQQINFMLRNWEISKDPRDHIALGVQAFLEAPDDFSAALSGAPKISGDAERIPERVAALLLGASGRLPKNGPRSDFGMLYFLPGRATPEVVVTDSSKTHQDPIIDPHAWDRHLVDFYAQWLRERTAKGISPDKLRDALAPMPGYFVGELSVLALRDPLLAKCLMVGFDLVDPQSFLSKDPEVRHELARRSGESLASAEFDELADKVTHLFRHNAQLYFPDQYQAGRIRDAELKEGLAQVPPIFLKALGDVERSPAQFLFLMHHFKLSDFGYPSYESLPE